MKLSSFASLALFFGPVMAISRTKVPSTAYILDEIPDGTPFFPEPSKPKFAPLSQDILKSQSAQQGRRTITVQEIKPIAHPPPPPPPVAQPSAEVTAEFQKRLDAYREENPRSGLLFLGAAVFRTKDSPPRTLIRYWPEGGKADITLWSSADLAPIQALHDLYNSEHARLEIAFKGRERARLIQEAHLTANPPQPKNLTLNYWRTETPTP